MPKATAIPVPGELILKRRGCPGSPNVTWPPVGLVTLAARNGPPPACVWTVPFRNRVVRPRFWTPIPAVTVPISNGAGPICSTWKSALTPATVTPGPGSGFGQPLIAVVLPITAPLHGCVIRESAGIVEKFAGAATCAFVSHTAFQPRPVPARAQNQPPSVPRNADPIGAISQPPGTGL